MVDAFVTTDGKKFDIEELASSHQRDIEVKEVCEQLASELYHYISEQALAEGIFRNWKSIVARLVSASAE